MSITSQPSASPRPKAFTRDRDREPELILREALTGTLATFDRDTGHPYASLVTVATAPEGTPLLLLSTLARHTRNLIADPRVSLLLTAPPTGDDPLTTPRLTVLGTVTPSARASAKARFVGRHPTAAAYADFGDFRVFEVEVSGGHLVAGFGRIVSVSRSALICPFEPEEVTSTAADLVAKVNAFHIHDVQASLEAAGLSLSVPPRLAGIDADGCDLVIGGVGLRGAFEQRATTSEGVTQHLCACLGLPSSVGPAKP